MAPIVYYELDKSPFFLVIDKFCFYFSSEFYKNKFENSYLEYIKCESLKLNVRYKAMVYANECLLLDLYKTIEKRGFKVTYDSRDLVKDYFIDMTLNLDYSGKGCE